MKRFSPLLLVPIACIFLSACISEKKKTTTGIKVYKEFDSTRLFDTTDKLSARYYRPVKIDLFYPSSEKVSGQALTFGDFLNMYEDRLDYTISEDSAQKSGKILADRFASHLHMSSSEKLLRYKTSIYRGLSLPERKLPLIIYTSGFNGGSWENPILFDSLARAGYVVAVISSVGKFPGFISKATDVDEQVKDIMFVKRKLKSLSFIDNGKIGLMSWSLGGNAMTKSAMLSNDFKCLLSLDGTEIHYYGIDTVWDKQFTEIISIPPHIPERIEVPFMYLSSERKISDSAYILPEYISSSEKYFLRLKGSIRESFSSLLPIAFATAQRDSIPFPSHYDVITRLTITFFHQFLNKDKSYSVSSLINQLRKQSPAGFMTDYPPSNR